MAKEPSVAEKLYNPPASILLYGGPGSGKTALGVSSFWDWINKKEVANGKFISFGVEDNPALGVPEHFRQTEKGTSLRLTSPLLDSTEFLTQFDLISRKLVHDAQQGNCLDVLFVDGLAEFDLLFEETFGGEGDNFAKWNGLLSQLFSMMQRLHHNVLGCQVIMTTRVMPKKKTRTIGRNTVAGDPDYMDSEYYPALRGGFREHMPHYFNLVTYVETVQAKTKDGRIVPAHAAHMFKAGDYYVKNTWEHLWLAAGKGPMVINKQWPALWAELTDAISREEAPVEEEFADDQ